MNAIKELKAANDNEARLIKELKAANDNLRQEVEQLRREVHVHQRARFVCTWL